MPEPSMEPFETTCVLWTADHTDAAVGGRIAFDRTDGLSVDLVGSLDPDAPLATVFEPPDGEEYAPLDEGEPTPSLDPGHLVPVVFGVVPGDEITLLNVFRSEGSTGMPGHAHDVLRPELLVRGAHLEAGFDTPVPEIAVQFDVLPAWYDSARVGVPTVEASQPAAGRFKVEWRTPEPMRATMANGDVVEFSLRSRRQVSPRSFSMSAVPQLSVKFAAETSLRQAIRAVTPLHWLVSLLTRRPARITQLVCKVNDVLGGVELVYQAKESARESGPVHPYAVALRTGEFNFAEAVPRWIDAAERLRTPLALMFANWFSSDLYSENRLLNAAAAAESLNARLYGKQRSDPGDVQEATENYIAAFPEAERPLLRDRLAHVNDPSLRDRLHKLADAAPASTALVVQDVDAWAGAVVKARNDIAHGTRLSNDGARLRALSESVEHLVETHLLMQLGISPDKVAEGLRDTPRTTWVARLVDQYVPEAVAKSAPTPE